MPTAYTTKKTMPQIIISSDNTDQVLAEVKRKAQAALEACGNQAVSHAKQNLTAAGRRDTGNLINSMTHKVQKDACYVGTDKDYAIYNEVGTGKFAADGNGRKGWWVYVVGEGAKKNRTTGKIYSQEEAAKIVAILRAKGLDARMTEGMKPTHFLKNAIQDHVDEYKSIIENELKK